MREPQGLRQTHRTRETKGLAVQPGIEGPGSQKEEQTSNLTLSTDLKAFADYASYHKRLVFKVWRQRAEPISEEERNTAELQLIVLQNQFLGIGRKWKLEFYKHHTADLNLLSPA